MPEQSWPGAEVRFIDYDATLRDIRKAVDEAKAAHPEITRVFLFGSFVEGTWTADSDADLFVVVRREFVNIFDRGQYAIFASSIPIDSIIYSESEFERLSCDPESFLAQNLAAALEL
jgi:predicted nucleotidyltransferase